MRTHVTASLLVLVGPLLAIAEQPDWEESARRLLAVRSHSYGFQRDYLGLWSYDPIDASWEYLRHFSFNAHDWSGSFGEGCALTSADGLLVVQEWPLNLELEPGSYRLLRRSSPIDDPAAVGWAVQGPAVRGADAAALGLAPGHYGIARCLWTVLPNPDPFHHAECAPYEVPGTGVSVECTEEDPWPLLRRDDTGGVGLVGLMSPLDWTRGWVGRTDAVPTLSLDVGHRALWRGTPRGVELLPIVDGGVGSPSLSRTFTFPPFDDPEVEVNLLYYHPGLDQLFLRARTHLITLSSSLDLIDDRDVGTGHPVTLTSLTPPPAMYDQLLPILAHTQGRNDTFWTSDLWLYNPSAEAATVTLRRVTAPAVTRTLNLAGHASVRIPDALAHLGGGPSGDGTTHDAVVLTTSYRWGEQVVAASRSFTAATGGGTYGHAVTAAPGRAGYSNHLVYPGVPDPPWPVVGAVPFARKSTLYADRRVPGQMRHNLGVVNDFDEPVSITLLWGHMEDGVWIYPDAMALRPASALQTLEVPPHSLRLVELDALFPPEVVEVWPPRIAVFGSRPVALWFSMVDNLTGDATFVPYSNLHGGDDVCIGSLYHVRSVVPVVAHTPGERGTFWRTDLYGADWLLACYSPVAWLHPSDPANDCGGAALAGEIGEVLYGEVAQPPDGTFDSWGNWQTVYRDVARAFCPCSGEEGLHGGLELLSADWLTGWTRTYTTRDDGGTYGEMLPFYPLGGWPVQHFAGVEVGSTFRVNVGLFNGDGEHAITHRITLYSSDGQIAAERTVTLQPYASLQRRLEHLFRMEVGTLPAGTYGMTVLPLDDPAHGVKGRSWAYVSLVDNVTNDPTNWW